jgi:hypothetical protein
VKYIRKLIYFCLIVYNWPILLALVILDRAKIDIEPQKKGKGFSFSQMIILTLVASFFSTLVYIVFQNEIVTFFRTVIFSPM